MFISSKRSPNHHLSMFYHIPHTLSVDAVVGPACSGACSAGADFLQIKDYPMISWDCTQPDLSNKPNFLRTVSDYGKVSILDFRLDLADICQDYYKRYQKNN